MSSTIWDMLRSGREKELFLKDAVPVKILIQMPPRSHLLPFHGVKQVKWSPSTDGERKLSLPQEVPACYMVKNGCIILLQGTSTMHVSWETITQSLQVKKTERGFMSMKKENGISVKLNSQ